MGPFDTVGQGAQGIGNLLNSFAAGGGNEYSQGLIQSQAVAKGMDKLSELMSQNGNDPARAMLQFAQDPVGHQVMASPGAFKALIDTFQQSQKNINPLEAASIPQGNTGVIQRGNQSTQSTNVTQQQNPQAVQTGAGNTTSLIGPKGFTGQNVSQPTVANTPAGATTTGYQNGQPMPGSQTQQPPMEFQNFKAFAEKFGSAFDKNTLSTMAMMNASNNEPSQRLAMAQQLTNNGAPADLAQAWAIGQYKLLSIPDYPGVYFLQDTLHNGMITQVPIAGTAPQGQQQPGQQQQPVPGQQGAAQAVPGAPQQPAYAGTPANPQDPKVQETANKYHTLPQGINADGMIDPVKAWGPGSLLALTSGLPAIIQADTATMSQWFDPRDTSAITEVSQQGKAMQDGLAYLLTSDMQNGRLKTVIENVEALGTEHEKDSSPQYAVDQLLNLRNVLGMQAEQYKSTLARMGVSSNIGPDRLPFDKAEIMKMNTSLTHINNILNFVPSEENLKGMKKAIQDGRVANVPSFATAAGSVIQTAKRAASAGIAAVTGPGDLERLNSNPSQTISQIKNASLKDLMPLIKLQGAAATPGTALNPVIQRALSERFEQLRAQWRPAKKQAPSESAMPPGYSGDTPSQGGNVQDFTNNPMRTASNPFEQVKQQARTQRSQMPFGGKNPTPAQRVKGGFSMFGM
jgi:hypothetical protein